MCNHKPYVALDNSNYHCIHDLRFNMKNENAFLRKLTKFIFFIISRYQKIRQFTIHEKGLSQLYEPIV